SVRLATAQTKASGCISRLIVPESRMRLLSWRLMVGRFVRRVSLAESSNWKQRDFCRLSVRRLEDRRVLSGTPVGRAVTVSDAKAALVVDSTHAGRTNPTFDVSLQNVKGKIELELTGHGTILYENEIANIASIRFQSLVNHGNLIVDFSNGHPI